MQYVVYILLCHDGTLYTGITRDLERRFREHQEGTGARYTRSHPPQKILYQEFSPDRGSALKREAFIKSLSRTEKFALVAGELPGVLK